MTCIFENFLKSTGYKRVINKSDGEPGMVSLKTKAVAQAGVEAVPQESPVVGIILHLMDRRAMGRSQ